MSRIFTLFFLLLFSIGCSFAQDDYVLDAKELDKPVIKKPIYNIPNPDYMGYNTTPTAFTLGQRDFRLASNDILFFKGSYGVTSKTTLSVNLSMFSSMVGIIRQQLKESDDFVVSVSASLGDLYSASRDTTILFTGTNIEATIGDHQNNLSFGTGIHYINSTIDIFNERREFFFHTINVGFQNQLSRIMYIVLDAMYFTNYGILTGGASLKFVIKRKYSINAGIMPVTWNEIRSTRYDLHPGVLPFFAVRMLIDRN